MIETLEEFLLNKQYIRVKIRLTKTNHFEVKATLNGVKGRFILDTGASNSCVGFEAVENFNLKVKDSKIMAAGAGAINMQTKISNKNIVKLGKWVNNKVVLVLFDLSHVNMALTTHKSKPVDGIIGADILKKTNAIIDYGKRFLYLKTEIL